LCCALERVPTATVTSGELQQLFTAFEALAKAFPDVDFTRVKKCVSTEGQIIGEFLRHCETYVHKLIYDRFHNYKSSWILGEDKFPSDDFNDTKNWKWILHVLNVQQYLMFGTTKQEEYSLYTGTLTI